MRSATRKKTGKDPVYRAFIQGLPCAVCALVQYLKFVAGDATLVEVLDRFKCYFRGVQRSKTEAAHVGIHGLSRKTNDRETIPLCRQHHQFSVSSYRALQHKFWAYHGIDRIALIAALNRAYYEAHGKVELEDVALAAGYCIRERGHAGPCNGLPRNECFLSPTGVK
jgi:hypothetical protein